ARRADPGECDPIRDRASRQRRGGGGGGGGGRGRGGGGAWGGAGAVRAGGAPPLSVQRHGVGSWPLQVRISDADAMLPGIRLASGGPITLIARISSSGQPIAASRGLFGEGGYDFGSAHPANITIDRIVP